MFDSPTFTAAIWGTLGCFVYAAPAFSAGWYSAVAKGTPRSRAILDFVIALWAGGILAAAFGGVIATILHQPDHRAMCAAVGLFGNAIAEKLVPLVRDKFLKRVDAEGPL